MKLTAELSLYPVQENYIAVIEAFIATLREHPDLKVVTNAMSTQVAGEHERVFAALEQETRRTFASGGRAVFVGGAEEQNLMAATAQVAGIKIGGQLAAHEVSQVLDPVDIGNGGGDEVTCHGSTLIPNLFCPS